MVRFQNCGFDLLVIFAICVIYWNRVRVGARGELVGALLVVVMVDLRLGLWLG